MAGKNKREVYHVCIAALLLLSCFGRYE